MTPQTGHAEIRRQPLPAWAFSVVLHLVTFLLLACYLRAGPKSSPPPGESDRTVGIVLTPRETAQRQPLFDSQAEARTVAASTVSSVESPAVAALPPPVLPELALPGRLESTLADPNTRDLIAQPGLRAQRRRPVILPGIGDEAILAADATQARPAGPSGPPGEVSLFGSPAAVGHSFVFVIDRSNSMGDGGLGMLAAAERELLKALAGLSPQHKFQIIAYNQKVAYFSDAGLTPATEANRTAVRQFFTSMAAFGGTEHEPALLSALRLKPDVIFLFTDGGDPHLNTAQIDRIVGRAGSATAIHCFQFGLGPLQENDNFMQRLADRTRGRYGYIDMSQARGRR